MDDFRYPLSVTLRKGDKELNFSVEDVVVSYSGQIETYVLQSRVCASQYMYNSSMLSLVASC